MALKLLLNGEAHSVDIVGRKPHLVVEIDGRTRIVRGHGDREGRCWLDVDGHRVVYAKANDGNSTYLGIGGHRLAVSLVDPRDAAETLGGNDDAIRAPMPGMVVSVSKSVGDTVAHGETVLTIESMKLQTNLTAPRDGVIAEITKSENATFDKDDIMVRLEAQTPAEGETDA